MSMFAESRDRQAQKTGDRLSAEVGRAQSPRPETGELSTVESGRPSGSRIGVSTGRGTVYGEMMSPSAVGKGEKVAIYYGGNSGALFDAL